MARMGTLQREGRARAERQPPNDHGKVTRLAYELFERRGRLHGFDQQDWYEAERMVRDRQRRRGGA